MSVEVKICGLKTLDALEAAIAARADYAGFVFFPPSPRFVDAEASARLAAAARGRIKIVALFVDPHEDELDAVVSTVKPDIIQLHGSEKPVDVRAIREWSGLPVFKAVSVRDENDALSALAYRGIADLILFDAKPAPDAANPGGNGETFNWRAIDAVATEIRFMLSGGLNASNVARAIEETGAAAVDVSSGVERVKGEKDPALIRRFVEAAKAAAFESV
ncbi:MAG: phosphoribosylanthranilate isomerase [Hyphomicrobiales bacterium]|nr:phosphoribosylanthranilate isomerase [Hyphomicrobiales bacterium]